MLWVDHMRTWGIFLVAAGLIWALIAFNMDTTVTTESQIFGIGEFTHRVPSQIVYNIGMMDRRQSHLMFAGLAILVGVILIGFGSIAHKNSAITSCPFCAEEIQDDAIKCKHCGEFLDAGRQSRFAEEKREWYFRKSFIIIAVCCVGPLALPLIWWRPQTTRSWKIGLTIGILVLSWILFQTTMDSIYTFMEYYKQSVLSMSTIPESCL